MKGLALLLAPKGGKPMGGGEDEGADDAEAGSVDERCDLLADTLGLPKEDREDFCSAFQSAVKAVLRSQDDESEEADEEPG